MNTRTRHANRLWIGILMVVGLIAAMAVAGLAAPSGVKYFQFTVSPSSVSAGASGQVFLVKVINASPAGSSSNISSLTVTVPSQFTITAADVYCRGASSTSPSPCPTFDSNPNASVVVSFSQTTGQPGSVTVTSLDPIKRTQFVTVKITVNVTSTGLTCGSNTSGNWSIQAYTGSQLNGDSFVQDPNHPNLTPYTTITENCLTFTVQPSDGVVNTAISPAVQVTASGAADGTNVTLSINTGPSGASISGATATTTSGVATFSNVKLSKPGTYKLDASASGYVTATSNSFVIRSLGFTVQPSDGVVNTAISPAVEVTLSDGASVNVTISKASGPGTLSGTLTKLASGGVASFDDLKLSATGTYTLLAAATGYGTATSSSFTVYESALVCGTKTTDPLATSGTDVTLTSTSGDCSYPVTITSDTVSFSKPSNTTQQFTLTISWGVVIDNPELPGQTDITVNGQTFTPNGCTVVGGVAQYPVNPDSNNIFWPNVDPDPNVQPEQPWCVASVTVVTKGSGYQLTETFLGSGDPVFGHT